MRKRCGSRASTAPAPQSSVRVRPPSDANDTEGTSSANDTVIAPDTRSPLLPWKTMLCRRTGVSVSAASDTSASTTAHRGRMANSIHTGSPA